MNQKKAGLLLSYLYNILHMVIGLFMSTFVLNRLGQTQYGVYQTVAAFVTYLVLFEFGCGTVMSRNIALCRGKNSEPEEFHRNISTVVFITLVLSVFIAIVSAVFYLNLGAIYQNTLDGEQIAYGKTLFLIMAGHLLISFWNQAFTGICNGFELFRFTKLLQLSTFLLRTVLVVVLLLLFPSPTVLVLVDTGISVIVFITTVLYCIKRTHFRLSLRLVDRLILKASMPLALALFLQSIVNQANNNVAKFLISIMLSPESVAIFSVGMYVYTTFSAISVIPISIFHPSVVKRCAAGMDEGFTATLVGPSRLLCLTGGAICFGFIAFGKPFINLFYGAEYQDAWYVAVIIMLPMFLNMCYGLLTNVLDALGKRMARSLILIGTTVLNIVTTIFAIPRFGMIGAALCTGVSTLVGQVILMNIYYKKKIGIRIGYLTLAVFKGLLPSLLLATAASVLSTYWIGSQWLSFLVGGGVYFAVLCVTLWLFGLNKQEKKMLFGKLNALRHKS